MRPTTPSPPKSPPTRSPMPDHPAIPSPLPVPPKPKPADTTQPNWTISGSGAFLTDRGRIFHGVGQAGGISHRSLLRAAADNRARTEMTTVLNSYMEALIQKAGSGSVDAETEQSMRSLTAELLKNAVIKEHFADTTQGRLFSLCVIEMKTVKQVFSGANRLEARTRERLVGLADQVHAQRMHAVP